MIFEPTSLPSTRTCWPLALPGKATWPIPVTSSGYSRPQTTISVSTPSAAVVNSLRILMFRFPLVEVSGQALDDRSEQERGEERERADEDDHADQEHHEGAVVGAHRA